MKKYKVTYFDFSGSRGEEVRLALAIAGVEFHDNRIGRDAFGDIRPDLPYPTLPVLEIEGVGAFGQSNAILRLIGRMHGLHPEDPYEAARHDGLMEAAEEFRQRIAPTMAIGDETEKLAKRRELADGYVAQWARAVERQIGDGPLVGGEQPHVADLKLYMLHRWITTGGLDGIPPDVFRPFEKLERLAGTIAAHPRVKAWQASST